MQCDQRKRRLLQNPGFNMYHFRVGLFYNDVGMKLICCTRDPLTVMKLLSVTHALQCDQRKRWLLQNPVFIVSFSCRPILYWRGDTEKLIYCIWDSFTVRVVQTLLAFAAKYIIHCIQICIRYLHQTMPIAIKRNTQKKHRHTHIKWRKHTNMVTTLWVKKRPFFIWA